MTARVLVGANQKGVPGGVPTLDEAGKLPDSQLPAFGRDRGAGTALPTIDLRRGDVYYYTPLSVLVAWNGLAWRMLEAGQCVAYSDLANVPTALRYTGARVRTAGRTFEWAGFWDIVAGPPPTMMLRMTTTQSFAGNFLVPYDSVDAGTYNPGGGSLADGDFFTYEGVSGRRVIVKRDGVYSVSVDTIVTVNGPELRLCTVPAANNFAGGITLMDVGGRSWAAADLNWTGFLTANTPVGQQLRTSGSATADNPQGYRQTFTITRLGS